MKRLLFISLAFTTLIIPVIISSACSHHNKVALKEDKIELRLRLSNIPLTNELLKPQPRNLIVNHKTKIQLDSLTNKLEKLNHKLQNNWFKGDNRPYKKILIGLKRQGYDLTNYKDECCDRKELSIQLANEWNMKEVNKIKNIIMRTLSFEPKVCMSHLPDGKEVTSMIWAGSKYNACVSQSGLDELIHLSFETN
jgi:hypothetical protein